jgi:hypothetical protein
MCHWEFPWWVPVFGGNKRCTPFITPKSGPLPRQIPKNLKCPWLFETTSCTIDLFAKFGVHLLHNSSNLCKIW